jgi:E1A/CREB-binding protein
MEIRTDIDTEESRKNILLLQQERLLYLRQSSKCTIGKCYCYNNDNDCSNRKIFWRHIINCEDSLCKRKQCLSSRYVLYHYLKCKNLECDLCSPVREKIKNKIQSEMKEGSFQILYNVAKAILND